MRVYVVAVGRLKQRAARELASEYLERLRRYVRSDEIELKKPGDLPGALPADAFVIALEVDGERLTSEGLARRIERWGSQGKGNLVFVIGGAEGIPDDFSARADARLSLSSLTLPHRLARVLLLEQLYRAMTILRGEPYARED